MTDCEQLAGELKVLEELLKQTSTEHKRQAIIDRIDQIKAEQQKPRWFRHLLFEWFAPSFMRGNLAQRFAFLLTLPDGLNWVAERKDNEDRDLLGNAQRAVDLRQAVEADPV